MKKILFGSFLAVASLAANAESYIFSKSGIPALDVFTARAVEQIALPVVAKFLGDKAGVYISVDRHFSKKNGKSQCFISVNSEVGLGDSESVTVKIFQDSPGAKNVFYIENVTDEQCTEKAKSVIAENINFLLKRTQEEFSTKL